MASEATERAVRRNTHMNTSVVEVTELNSKVRSDLQGRLEAAVASEAIEVSICTWISG